MALIVKGEKSYTLHPPGLFQAVCCDVVDLGDVDVTFNGRTQKQHKLTIVWQSEEKDPDNGGKPFLLRRRYTASLDERANLRRDLESWRGRPFTDEELKGFDVEKLIGVNAFINVLHGESDGKHYANVATITLPRKGTPKMTVLDYTRAPAKEIEAEPTNYQEQPAAADFDDVPFIKYDVPSV